MEQTCTCHVWCESAVVCRAAAENFHHGVVYARRVRENIHKLGVFVRNFLLRSLFLLISTA